MKSQYNKTLKQLARKLRNESTRGETLLWNKVLKGSDTGYQFNRQYPMRIDDVNMIVDFICRALKLVIEIDGSSHNDKYEADSKRDRILTNHGYTVLRFTEHTVRYDIDHVVSAIEQAILQLATEQHH